MEKKLRQRLELRKAYEDQLAMREVMRQAMKEEEEAFRQSMLAKFAEDDRVEQMNAQKRRMKQLEHRREVEKLIEERRKQFIADKVRNWPLLTKLTRANKAALGSVHNISSRAMHALL